MNGIQAARALGEVEAARAAVARAIDCPPWRHAAFGAVMGMLVLAPGVDPRIGMSLETLAFVGIAAIFVSDRRRMGMFVNGYRKGATRPLTLLLLVAMLGLAFAEYRARHAGLAIELRLGIGLGSGALATAASVVWQRIFRRELGAA